MVYRTNDKDTVDIREEWRNDFAEYENLMVFVTAAYEHHNSLKKTVKQEYLKMVLQTIVHSAPSDPSAILQRYTVAERFFDESIEPPTDENIERSKELIRKWDALGYCLVSASVELAVAKHHCLLRERREELENTPYPKPILNPNG